MADQKITALGANTAPVSTDILPMVDDPGGAPATQKITFANFWQYTFNYIASLTAKTTLTGADIIPINDSAASSVGKGITWTNFVTAFFTSGTLQMIENNPLILDAALSADGKYSGVVEAGTAGATLAFGDIVYLAVADSRWELTDADAAATAGPVKVGMCVLAAAADGDPTTILLYGKIRADSAFPTFTIGAPVYISTTAGDVQVAAPSGAADIVRIVGYGNTADELFFCPDNTFIELS